MLPHAKVGLNPMERLTHRNECRDVEDPVWGQVVQFNLVVVQQPTEEVMRWKPQASFLKGSERDHLVGPRPREAADGRDAAPGGFNVGKKALDM
jgi:hypothetical protein